MYERTQRASVATIERSPDAADDDPRWQLAQSVAAGPHFARSPLLSRFLLYVVSETIKGRQAAISEHKIGVAVFGRPHSYRTDDDNIVRNYARQLRKRLAEHFGGEGRDEPMRIEIPTGGYVPIFSPRQTECFETRAATVDTARSEIEEPATQRLQMRLPGPPLRRWLLLCAILIVLTALLAEGIARKRTSDPLDAFWNAILPANGNTFVIPPDAGLNLMEDMAQRAVPLAMYIRGTYDLPEGVKETHVGRDLRGEQYTDFITLQIVASLAHQKQYDPHRALLRFPRDLRLDDFKDANAVIIGSASANPWATLGDGKTNFCIVLSADMESARILNAHPLRGEENSYQSHWNEPAHETFGLIQLLPNLGGSGELLFIQGLDAAGTQAAAELLFHSTVIAPILKKAQRPDGTFRPFEILLRATSIQSNAEGTVILASRIQ